MIIVLCLRLFQELGLLSAVAVERFGQAARHVHVMIGAGGQSSARQRLGQTRHGPDPDAGALLLLGTAGACAALLQADADKVVHPTC